MFGSGRTIKHYFGWSLLCTNGPQTSLNLFCKKGNRHQQLTVLVYLHGHDHRYFALALHDDAFNVAKSLFVIITLQLIFKANYFFMVSRQAVSKLSCFIRDMVKPSQNKKGQKIFQLHSFLALLILTWLQSNIGTDNLAVKPAGLVLEFEIWMLNGG